MKKIILGSLLMGLPLTNAFSGGMMGAGSVIATDKSIVPQSAFFGGLGGGWSSGSFGNQDVYGKGTSYSPPYETHTAQVGSAAGSTSLELNSQSALAPVIQVGYFKHFSGSQWMGGSKLSYSYLGIGSANSQQQIPQAGGFTEDGVYTPFTGNYLIQSYRQTINQQISLIPLIGRSFERSYVYSGVGPTTVQTKTLIENITGFESAAVIPTTPTGIGLGKKYSTTQWLFGGVAMLGATYFIDPTWFLDISYTYSMTGTKTSRWGGPWTDTDIARGYVSRSGTNTGTSSGSVNVQALVITINKAF
ncbi:MAG: hypothetical protein Q8R79_08595 [Legionellaceae bacterium]|nr:hypothetical protein [Legionellaceae bacterium]